MTRYSDFLGLLGWRGIHEAVYGQVIVLLVGFMRHLVEGVVPGGCQCASACQVITKCLKFSMHKLLKL